MQAEGAGGAGGKALDIFSCKRHDSKTRPVTTWGCGTEGNYKYLYIYDEKKELRYELKNK